MQGAERFANYKGYGKSLSYGGEHVDQSDVRIANCYKKEKTSGLKIFLLDLFLVNIFSFVVCKIFGIKQIYLLFLKIFVHLGCIHIIF